LIGLKGGEDRCSVLKEEEKLRRNGEKGSNGKMPLDYFKQTDKHEGWPIDQAKEEEKGEMEKGKIFLHNRCVHQSLSHGEKGSNRACEVFVPKCLSITLNKQINDTRGGRPGKGV
jgi:hypothetical protein